MSKQEIPYKIYLREDQMPKAWYNVRADMKNKPAPLLDPESGKPISLEKLSEVFCRELAMQELDDTTAYIPIPKEISDFYKMYRPAPLVRAYCLEKKLGTPAKIYYKFEGNNTSGSHKLNSAIAQAYYAKQQGLKGVTTETGAGHTASQSTGNLSGLFHHGIQLHRQHKHNDQRQQGSQFLEHTEKAAEKHENQHGYADHRITPALEPAHDAADEGLDGISIRGLGLAISTSYLFPFTVTSAWSPFTESTQTLYSFPFIFKLYCDMVIFSLLLLCCSRCRGCFPPDTDAER